MNLSILTNEFPLDRETLEKLAFQEVCACQYYDLADCMDATSDQELIDIITHNYDCEMCGRKSKGQGGAS